VFSGTAAQGRVSLAGGVFNDWFVESGSADDNATQIVGRITWLPYLSEDEFSLLHLGLGVRRTNAKEGLRYRSRPEMGNAPMFVDTDLFSADASTLVNLEASWRSGSFWILGEFTDNRIDSSFRSPSVTPVIGTSAGLTIMDTSFHGYHVEVGWALTGEMRPYVKRKGVFRGVPVAQSIYRGGLGSWEIGMRYSSLDLSDGLIEGGEIDVLTVGLSWWLTNKFMAGVNIKRSATDRFGVNGDVNSLVTRFTLIL
jgi:phosphate-selective porin OprO/OprP